MPVKNWSDESLTALAAYEDLTEGVIGSASGNRDILVLEGDWAQSQVELFAEIYSDVLQRYTDNESNLDAGKDTGFSVTVFADGAAGSASQVSIAFRGTEGFFTRDLFVADADIASFGAGYGQIVAMYNWWQREANPDGLAVVPQFDVQDLVLPPAGSVLINVNNEFTSRYLVPIDDAVPSNNLSSILDLSSSSVSLTGHSLGGHLALAFNAIFTGVSASVITFNSPGFANSTANQNFFAALGGVVPGDSNATTSNVNNLQGNEVGMGDPGWDAIAGLRFDENPQGVVVEIPIENQLNFAEPDQLIGSLNHSMQQLVDALAVFNLYALIDSSLNETDFDNYFQLSSNIEFASHESLVNSIVELFQAKNSGVDIPLVPGGNSTPNRELLYNAINKILEADGNVIVEAASNGFLFADPVNVGANVAADFGAFLTIQLLTPFAFSANESFLSGLYPDLHSLWSAGGFSAEYIADRTLLYEAMILDRNVNDSLSVGSIEGESIIFTDVDKGSFVAVDAVAPSLFTRIVFGNSSDNLSLTGGSGNDRLYGLDGVDFLNGEGGDDLLEGGKDDDFLTGGEGNDQLKGGEGFDQYLAGAGDVITDSDGLGAVHFDGTFLTGGSRLDTDPANQYTSTDGQFVFLLSGTTLTITNTTTSGTLVVEDYDISISTLGLTLEEESDAGGGDDDPIIGSPNDDRIGGDGDGQLTGTEGDDEIQGLAGDDDLVALGGDDVLSGDGGADILVAGDGLDRLIGGSGDDILLGEGGADDLAGGTGEDILFAGDGNDVVTGDDDDDFLAGGEGVDLLVGGDGEDIIFGDATLSGSLTRNSDFDIKNTSPVSATVLLLGISLNHIEPASQADGEGQGDRISGGDGNDFIAAGSGRDIVFGDAGSDFIFGGSHDDFLDGGTGNDRIFGDRSVGVVSAVPGNDVISGGDGDDIVIGGLGNDSIFGGAGNDELIGDEDDGASVGGDDSIDAGAGDDLVIAGGGDDTVFGGAGQDQLQGGFGDDALDGGDDNDFLLGMDGDDVLTGGSGVDTLHGDAGMDELFGGDGDDLLLGGDDDDVLEGDAGIDVLQGNAGNDVLRGGIGNDLLLGQDGDDVLEGGEGDDELQGGAGDDTLSGGQGIDVLFGEAGNDSLEGGDGNDALSGGADDDVLIGGSGDDLLDGGAGDDVIIGGLGNDTIIGGDGSDSLESGGGDTFLDGGAGNDTYIISADAASVEIAEGGDNDTLRFSGGFALADLTLNRQNGTLFVAAGSTAVTYNGWGDSASKNFELSPSVSVDTGTLEAEINDAPEIANAIVAQEALTEVEFVLDVAEQAFTDPESDPLLYSASLVGGDSLPSWMSLDASTGRVTGTPNVADLGEISIEFTAADPNGLAVSQVFSLLVGVDGNTPPEVAFEIPNLSARTGLPLNFSIPTGTFIDVDEGDSLTYSATLADGSPLPSWLIFDTEEQLFRGTPVIADIGQLSVLMLATDESGDSASDEFKITVANSSDQDRVSVITNDGSQERNFGEAVFGLGDINGDGYDDIYVTQYRRADEEPRTQALLVFLGGAETYPASFGLNELDSGVGRLSFTEFAFGSSGGSASRAEALGDLNGDGYEDFAFHGGELGTEGSGFSFSRVSVVFGGRSFGTRDLDTFSGISGFQNSDALVIKNIGDINGDGYSDLVHGENVQVRDTFDRPNFDDSEPATLVFGRPNINSLNGTTLAGIGTLDAAGDFNGDGRNDPIFINNQFEAYILFEGIQSFSNIPSFNNLGDIESLTFNINREYFSADYIGDFNGDGLDDLLVTAELDPDSDEGQVYVVFGRADVNSITGIDLTTFDGSNGFALTIPSNTRAISAGGDVDGDGQTDLLVVGSGATENSAAAVVFGRSDGFGGSFDVADISTSTGINIIFSGDRGARVGSITSDLNGDGFNDIVLGNRQADGPERSAAGEVVIIYGRDYRQLANFVGDNGNNLIVADEDGFRGFGLGGDDTFQITGGTDVFVNAGGGNNQVTITGGTSVEVVAGAGNNSFSVDLGGNGPSPEFSYKFGITSGSNGSDFHFSGSGPGSISINGSSGGNNSLSFGDRSFSSIGLGFGSLKITVNGAGYDIHLEDFNPNDVLGGPRNIDVFHFTDGDVTYEELVNLGFDIDGTADDDNLSGTNLVDRMKGFEGNDQIEAGDGNDTLSGGLGNDTLDGGTGDDTFQFTAGDGQDVLIDAGGLDTLSFGAGILPSAFVVEQLDSDLLIKIGATDQLILKDWFVDPANQIENFIFADDNSLLLSSADIEALATDSPELNVITGTSSSNTLVGTEAADQIEGLAGNDNISGLAGDDVIIGGEGNDTLDGGEGDDSFLITGTSTSHDTVTGGDGIDTILGGDDDDTFRFHNFSGTKTVEIIDGGLGTNEIAGTSSSNTIDLSGTALLGISQIDGGAGNDNITGSSAADVIIGGEGNDTLNGAEGDDVFQISGTSTSHDTITGGDGNDTILGSDGDDTFRFHNFSGTKTVEIIDGGAGNNIIAGTSSSNTINLSGTDLLGIDQIDGGAGNDNITGSAGDDVIIGGEGNDTLNGGAGDDVFLISGTSTSHDTVTGGEGFDIIQGSEDDDTFRFHNFSGTKTVEVIDGGVGNNIIAGTSSSNTIDLSGTALLEISQIDGGAGNDNITGSSAGDFIIGGEGNDTLNGGEGDDVFQITGTSTSHDTITGGDGSDTILGGDDDDTFRFHNFSGTKTVEIISGGLGNNVISGTSSSNTIDLSGTNLLNVSHIDGGAGNDNITGSSAADVIIGGAGNDTLNGGEGDDVFQITGTSTSHDTITGGDGSDTVLGGDDDDTFRFHNFSGTKTVEVIDGGLGNNIIAGTSSSNTIDLSGTNLLNISQIDGGAGNDNITGSSAADVIIGGAGNDTLNGGAGDDVFQITGTSTSHDTITGGDGSDTVLGGDDDDTFRFHNFSGTKTVETIDGGLGNNVIAGTSSSNTIDLSGTNLLNISQIDGGAGNDNITGSNAADVIIGGAGNDTLNGGAGDDVFQITGTSTSHDTITGGDGSDTILGGDDDDTFRFHNFSGTKTVEVIDGGLGNNIIAGTSSSNTIDLSGTNLLNISQIEGGAGNDNITGSSATDIIIGGAGNDTLNGGAGDDVFQITGTSTSHDTITGGDGADTILGGDDDDTFRFHNYSGTKTVEVIDGGLGNNVIAGTSSSNTIDLSGTNLLNISEIDGGAGNDNITGSSATDIIVGGTGNDTLKGGEGNDRYFFDFNSGRDVIRESGLIGDNDVLQFGALIDYEDLWFSKSGNSLVISQVGSEDSITIQDWYNSEGYRIETIESAAGVLSSSDIDQLVDAMAEFAAPIGISGAYTQEMTDTLGPLLDAAWQLY